MSALVGEAKLGGTERNDNDYEFQYKRRREIANEKEKVQERKEIDRKKERRAMCEYGRCVFVCLCVRELSFCI